MLIKHFFLMQTYKCPNCERFIMWQKDVGPKKFVSKESFKHKMAKELLAKWLREAEEGNDHCNFAQFTWRSNYGVYEELPFYTTSDPYYFESSDGLRTYHPGEEEEYRYHGDFLKCVDRGAILFVPDIAVFHKGTSIYFFEVVHKHKVSEDKIERIKAFFNGYALWVYEVEAEEILRQTEVPKYLKVNKVISL